MEYSRIVAVTGMPGLYEIINSKSDGAIVRSLEDESTKFVSSRVHNLSHLESIEIYTTGENVSLADVFAAMKNSTETLPDVKDNKALKSYFEKAYPEMDTERVYSSDMKKMVNWFGILQKHTIDHTAKEEDSQEEEVEEVVKETKAETNSNTKKAEAKPEEVKPVKEAATPKATSKKAVGEEAMEAPAKEEKEAAKKKAAPAKKKKSEE